MALAVGDIIAIILLIVLSFLVLFGVLGFVRRRRMANAA
jgi:multisubunit Na+/H+ antiporter MnhG subunit